MSILSKIFGDPNEKYLRKLQPLVDQINALEKEFETLSDEELKKKTEEFKEQLNQGKTLDDILPEAFAVVREAAKRTLNQRHYDVQLLGGIVLHQGQIAEMKTGEGKTLTSTLAVYLNALAGQGVHVVTVNDYLAKRDAEWMGQVYDLLGLTIGCIQNQNVSFLYNPGLTQTEDQVRDRGVEIVESALQPCDRQEAYAADIIYGTNNEFGFDYLRDNMAGSLNQLTQRGLRYAIVDEVDSILIDEARTPLIISAPAEESTDQYYKFASLIKQLKLDEDYNIDEKRRAATLTEAGIAKMEKALGVDNIYVEGGIRTVHHLEQALRAETLFKKDKDYVVKDGEIIIVDEFTGRLMPGRRYSEGLHQALEAKEDVEIQRESQTLATITFQNLFRLYDKLAGMTGTALTEAEEFAKIYNLDVTVIPTNKPLIRQELSDRIYKSEMGKFQAVVREIKERHEKGQPVLVGTISIQKNELLGQLLDRSGVPHQALNAKNHEKEASIIAQAGRTGAVTIATNMAGRGVDIILGGNPASEAAAGQVRQLGGLHVIGTERHDSRRIDNQLRGRAGRQGDPGSSQFYVSLEDDLMRIFGSDRIKNLMTALKVPEDMPIENKIVTRSLETAQKKVEGHNFDIRKHVVEYDDVLNKHREVIYKKRREILELEQSGLSVKDKILEMVKNEIEQVVGFHTQSDDQSAWDLKEVLEVIGTIFQMTDDEKSKLNDIYQPAASQTDPTDSRIKIIEYLMSLARDKYQALEGKVKETVGNDETFRQIEKGILLRSYDQLWVEHLEAITHLRRGIGLRGYGQRDPLVEYKKEAFKMFNILLASIQKQVVYSVYKISVGIQMAPSLMQRSGIRFSAPAKTGQTQSAFAQNDGNGQQKQVAVQDDKFKNVGRNDPCPCGSGKKFKKCHGA